MAFGFDLDLSRLATLADDIADAATGVRQRLARAIEDARLDFDPPAISFDGSAFRQVFALGGLEDLAAGADFGNLNDLAALAGSVPGFSDPDATGEVPTGSSAIGREEAALGATLSAAARIIRALGPEATAIEARGEAFLVAETYEDPASGFSAVRLVSADGGEVVFSIDGLEVGSRADEVAAATLGRLQVESAAFRDLVADAAALGLEGADLTIVGPSLGGAVAQVAAYETAEALLAAAAAPPTVDVRLVTVDALGGADAARAINGGILRPEVLAEITALNLRTENDLVSRIGSHVGATYTLPAVDEAGNPVQLDAAEAHVNVASLLQVLESDALFAQGRLGATQEIGGFAALSAATSDPVAEAWLASDPQAEDPRALQITGTASLDPTRTLWSLDADDDGDVDIAVRLAAPLSDARADLVLG